LKDLDEVFGFFGGGEGIDFVFGDKARGYDFDLESGEGDSFHLSRIYPEE